MIFPKPLDRLVLDGRKTMFRRPVAHSHGELRPCVYRPGHSYVASKANGTSLGRIEIVSRRRERAGDISFQDARAEGHRTTDAWRAWWVEHYDAQWLARQGAPVDITAVVERFHARMADAEVWVLGMRLHDTPRILTSGGPSPTYRRLPNGRVAYMERPAEREGDGDHGYSANPGEAMRDDPGEGVEADRLEEYARDAAERAEGLPGRREELARRLLRANSERVKRLLAAGHDPGEVLAALEQTDRHLRGLESQRAA